MSKTFSRVLALVLAMVSLFAFSASAEVDMTYIDTPVIAEMGFASISSITETEDNRMMFALAATFDVLLAEDKPDFFAEIVGDSVTYEAVYVSLGDGTVNLHWFDETGCLTFLYYMGESGEDEGMGGFFFFEAEDAHLSADMFMETCLEEGSVSAYYEVNAVSYGELLIEVLSNAQA